MVTSLDINADEHPIKSVTIFKFNKAEIVRTFSLNLKAGQYHVEISGLSSAIDTESARVSILGDARLLDIVCTLNPQKSSKALGDAEEEAIRILEAEKRDLQSERSTVYEQADIHVYYAKTLRGDLVSPINMTNFIQNLVPQKKEFLKAISELDEKILDLERQIIKKRERLALRKGKAEAKVSAAIMAQVDGPVKLDLTYMVGDARWEPTYELHATTENGKTSSSVLLDYRAKISQTTGEDWKDINLILSTASADMMMGGIPPLSKFYLGVVENAFGSNVLATRKPVQEAQSATQATFIFGASHRPRTGERFIFGAPDQAGFPSSGLKTSTEQRRYSESWSSVKEEGDGWDSGEEIPSSEMSPVAEGVNKRPLSVSYAVEGTLTILSDGESHKVSVAILPFESDVTWITMPRQQAVVYMQSSVKNTSDYRLLPGTISVFLDNSFVSRTRISDINTGSTFQCTFGVDTSIRTSYTRTSKVVEDPAPSFAKRFKTTTFTSTTKISNQHLFPISIVSKDAVPLCEDKRVKVILRKPEGLADTKSKTVDLKREDGIEVRWGKATRDTGGEKEGMFEWAGIIPGGKDATLIAEWEVKCPVNVEWKEGGDRPRVH